MKSKPDHTKARAKLARLAPDALQVITIRLPAGLLIEIHKWAEQHGMDLSSAIREWTGLGKEPATQAGREVSDTHRTAVQKWRPIVARAVQAGRSPLEPFLGQASPEPDAGLEALPEILAALDYRQIFPRVKAKLEEKAKREPLGERIWQEKIAESSSDLQSLMAALDNLASRYLARKKLFHQETADGVQYVVHWLISDTVMTQMKEAATPTNDKDIDGLQKLISARYLIAENSSRPWEFVWDE